MSWRLVSDIDGHWGQVEPLLLRCFADGFDDFSIEDLHARLTAGKMRLLVYCEKPETVDLSCIFEIVKYPAKRVFRVVALAGRVPDGAFAEWEAEVEEFAGMLGCQELEAWCKDAQARLFRRWGLQKRFNVVRKEIGHAG